MRRRKSRIWKHYEYINKKIAKCKTCNKTYHFSYPATSSLKKHIAYKHPNLDPFFTKKYAWRKKQYDPDTYPFGERKKTSSTWKYFKVLDRIMARCRICHKRLSYRSSITNLKKHIQQIHPGIPIDKNTQVVFPDSPIQENADDMDDNSFPDDVENVKALLGLTGAQVDKTIEIIEEDVADNGDHEMSYDDNNYDDDFNDEDNELIIKKTAKPVLQKCLEAAERNVKKEPLPPPVVETPAIKKPDDAVDILLKNIESKLRKMNEKQQMIAEYKIHEILFLGMSNQLKYGDDDNSCQHITYTVTTNGDATM